MKLILSSLLFVIGLSTAFGDKDSIHTKVENPFHLHQSCLEHLQSQINEEMHASLVYMNMASHFNTLAISRKGFHKFFEESSKEEREHAKKLMDYVTTRGGTVKPLKIKMPSSSRYNSAMDALESALDLEQKVNKYLHELHEEANKVCDDPHLMDFIENEYLTEQVESIAQLKRYIAILSNMDNGMGEYLLDKELNGDKIEL